jgi:hypothetical protein
VSRKYVTHVRPGYDSVTWLCGRRVVLGPRANGHYTAHNTREASCRLCKKLQPMSVTKRVAFLAAERAKNQIVFSRLKSRKAWLDAWGKLDRFLTVEINRPHAMVALDALQEGRARDLDVAEYVAKGCAIALVAHRLANPKSRGDRLWCYVGAARGWTETRCKFCNGTLETDVRMGTRGHRSYINHTAPCALRYLAGDLAPKINPEVMEAP